MNRMDQRLGISFFVGDLHPQVTEEDLLEMFQEVGPLFSLHLCRDSVSHKSLEYGYVNLSFACHAYSAMECLNYPVLKGKTMRIMMPLYERNHVIGKENHGNLLVKNLDESIYSARLHGISLSCKDAEDEGVCKGSGLVQLQSENPAMAAIVAVHKSMVEAKKLYVCKFHSEDERTKAGAGFTLVYLENLDEDVTENILMDKLSECGNVSSVVIMKMKSRGFGFINFYYADMDSVNGQLLGSKNLIVGRTAKRMEGGTPNLYVMNLNEESVDDRKLEGLFICYGTVSSTRMVGGNGCDFIRFSSPFDANNVLYLHLAGSYFGGRPLNVAFAQHKEQQSGNWWESYGVLNTNVPQTPYWNLVGPNGGETGESNQINGIKLPEDLLFHILAFTTRLRYPSLRTVSKYFNDTLTSPELFKWRRREGRCEPSLYFCIENVNRSDWYTEIKVREDWTCIPLPAMPNYHVGGGAAAIGPQIFVMGGTGLGDPHTRTSTLYIFDAITNRWATGPSMRVGRWRPACGVWNNHIYVLGGMDPLSPAGTFAEKYNVETQYWEEVSDPPVPLIYIIIRRYFVNKNIIYAMIEHGLVADRELVSFDMINQVWTHYSTDEFNQFSPNLTRAMVDMGEWIYRLPSNDFLLQVSSDFTAPWTIMSEPELYPESGLAIIELANLGGQLMLVWLDRFTTRFPTYLHITEIRLGRDDEGHQTGMVVRRHRHFQVQLDECLEHCLVLEF